MNRSIVDILPAAMLGSAAKSKAEFHHRLESLRGIAALMVAGWHSFGVLETHGWQLTAWTGICIILNGHAAVLLFFVLSGLVLGLSLERSKESFGVTYTQFCARRILRICPAYWVALLVITGAILSLAPATNYPAGVSSWFASHWSMPITGALFLQNFLFQSNLLNQPAWSLRTELICSFLLPVLVLISQKANWIGRAILLALLMALSVQGGNSRQSLYLFYLGYLVPTFGSALVARLGTAKLISRFAPSLALAILLTTEALIGTFGWRSGLIEGAMASAFVSFLYHGHETGWFRVFDWPIARFYGRISYSFYLYHMVTLYLIVRTAIHSIPTRVLMAQPLVSGLCLFFASTAIATLLGWLSYKAVESPAIRFSKELSRILRPKQTVATPSTG